MNIAAQKGYTLIEIMVAAAIVAILAAIAVGRYDSYIDESRISTAIKDIRQAEIILDDLAADVALRAIDGNDTSVRGLYLANGALRLRDPVDPSPPAGTAPWLDPWDRTYRYQRSDTASQDYRLFSLGEDGTAGTADDVAK